MKSTLQSSVGVEVRVVEYEGADIVRLVGEGKIEEITIAINADRRQKVALVDFRKDFSSLIGEGDEEATPPIKGLGFARLVVDTIKRGEETIDVDETAKTHIDRFRAALGSGSFKTEGFTLSSGDEKAKEASVEAFMQKLAFTLGDTKDENGNSAYTLDITRTPRTGSGGLIPKWAKDGAGKIIANGSQKAWAEKFTTGFTSPAGIVIDPIPFEAFDAVAEHHATAEQKQAVHEGNVKRLAKALMAYDKAEKAKKVEEFV